MKVYSEEFKPDAVALYLSDPTATYASGAKDLGVNRETPGPHSSVSTRWFRVRLNDVPGGYAWLPAVRTRDNPTLPTCFA